MGRRLWVFVCDRCRTSLDLKNCRTAEDEQWKFQAYGWTKKQAKKRVLLLCPNCGRKENG